MQAHRTKTGAVAALLAAAAALALSAARPGTAAAYEVWITDQSDTAPESGGLLYAYDGESLAADPAAAKPVATIDFAGEVGAYCRERTGRALRRPHMLLFTNDHRFAALSFLSGQVLFLDARSRAPVGCVLVGKNVHAAFPTADRRMVVGANIAEKALLRVWTDYAGGTFRFDPRSDVLDLAALEGPGRPDNAPICPVTDASGRYAFVTLRGGGLIVVDVTVTPMTVVATATREEIGPAGCGGVQIGRTMFVNSGGGWPATPISYDVYAVDTSGLPAGISVRSALSRKGEFADSHGMTAVGGYLWSADRAGNRIDVIDGTTGRHVGTIPLAGGGSDDPAPDLIGAAPDGSHVFMALRGPSPLTGNHPEAMNAKGSTPGVGVVRVSDGGRGGTFVGVARITNMRGGKETADAHAIGVRR